MTAASALLLFAGLTLEAQQTGAPLYQRNCAPCHGPNGEGGTGPSLRLLSRGSDEATLIGLISKGIPGTAMPGFSLDAGSLQALAMRVREFSMKGPGAEPAAIERGRALVNGKGGCLRCHTINGEGGFIGPDLTRIGLSRSIPHLRTSLTDPEAHIADRFGLFHWHVRIKDDFLWVRVRTAGGATVEGSRVNEDPFTMQIRDFNGRFHSFDKDGSNVIEKLTGKSPMPSFRDAFTPAELDDAAGYLSSLRSWQ
jgi:putative heme-binding domain-containing protein